MDRLKRVLVVFTVMVALTPWGAAGQARAQASGMPPSLQFGAWEQTALAAPVSHLIAPSNGALFATGIVGEHFDDGGAVWRSDDGGASWAPVALPPRPVRGGYHLFEFAADPGGRDVYFASGKDGLYRSADGGATWQLVLATAEGVEVIAPSAADPQLVYAAMILDSTRRRFLRSRDGGASWVQIGDIGITGPAGSPCVSSVRILMPHPTDAARLFRTAGCYAGRSYLPGIPLDHSRDQGTTLTDLFRLAGFEPAALAGGQGTSPARFYLAAQGPSAYNPETTLVATDDDWATWRVLASWDAVLRALVYDPAAPDHAFVALTEGDVDSRVGRVEATQDGGESWSTLPLPAWGGLWDLALGADGQALYAATDTGVWWLRLHAGAEAQRAAAFATEPTPTNAAAFADAQRTDLAAEVHRKVRGAASCRFVLGFAALHDALPSIVGDCTDDQAFAANGDAVQHTTGGLLVWRKADNWTAFTDGFHTWINGPAGIQSRLNTERLPWEADYRPGLVTSADGTPLAGATICLAVAAYPANPVATSDDRGRWTYVFPYDRDETLTVWAEKDGYTFTPTIERVRTYHGPYPVAFAFVGQPSRQGGVASTLPCERYPS